MTLLPTESWDVVVREDIPRYKVGPQCAVPGCTKFADHAHHIFRRSFLTGDYHWVVTPDGVTLGNVTGLCWKHHQQVTGDTNGHQAWIRWDGGRFTWSHNLDGHWQNWGPLDPHPPFETPEANTAVLSPPEPQQGSCPTCGRRKPVEGLSRLPGRPRKTWLVSVPDDGEDGALVLDVLVDECAKVLHRDDHSNYRYFVLTEALALLLQHKERMVDDPS